MKLLTWMIFCLLPFGLKAQVIEIHTIDEILSHIDKETLVIFDVDMVLVQPENPAFQMVNLKKHRKISRAVTKKLSPEEKDRLLNLMVIESNPILIENQTPKVFAKIKENGMKVIALTACYTGSLGSITDMGDWRIKRLRSLGYDFTDSFPSVGRKIFHHFPKINGAYPRFDRGILFANGGTGNYTKGDVLKAFFLHSNFLPKKVLFVDDRRSNLEATQKALPKGVEFLGFHYLGGASYRGEILSEEAFKASWEEIAVTSH